MGLLFPAQTLANGELDSLAKLQRGRWELRELDGGVRARTLCVRSPLLLVQLEHRGAACTRSVVSSDARGATVHYSCPGRGFGQTTVRVETPRLARVETQGIASGAPFSYRFEAKYLGGC
jgi:hypothetical protein